MRGLISGMDSCRVERFCAPTRARYQVAYRYLMVSTWSGKVIDDVDAVAVVAYIVLWVLGVFIDKYR